MPRLQCLTPSVAERPHKVSVLGEAQLKKRKKGGPAGDDGGDALARWDIRGPPNGLDELDKLDELAKLVGLGGQADNTTKTADQ